MHVPRQKAARKLPARKADASDASSLLVEKVHAALEEFLLLSPPRRLPRDFYIGDTLHIAQRLLHCILWTKDADGIMTAGRISEVEAYMAPDDAASHAAGNKRTKRNAILFEEGGKAYVYTCYGIHSLINIVTQPAEVPHCVLIRAILPVVSVDVMRQRRRLSASPSRTPKVVAPLGRGPGCVGQCLGLTPAYYGSDVLTSGRIWITEPADCASFLDFLADRGYLSSDRDSLAVLLATAWAMPLTGKLHIRRSPRIGIESTGDAQYLEYRFFVADDLSVTRSPFNKSEPKDPQSPPSTDATTITPRRRQHPTRLSASHAT